MHSVQAAIETVVVGMALSVVLYWVSFLFGRLTTDINDFKWWAKVTLLQGVVLAAALKILKVF